MAEPVAVAESITVKELADKLGLKVTDLIGQLMKQGVLATINERVDFATAEAAAEALGAKLVAEAEDKPAARKPRPKVGQGQPRPPVVAMMGHVDHGKTTLLDAIRQTQVAEGEAGGITQHLTAYQIEYKGRQLTFLDTPGHEAFSLLREHGAHLTDVALIVVAADDGVKPQTAEAIKFAQQAGVKMVAAITKIDKPAADLNRLKKELAELGLTAEEWGGDTVMVEVSAKTGKNLDKLLDLVLLVADIEELKATPTGPAAGTVIEAHMDRGKGAVATLLVEQGELQPGDYLVSGATYGRVRRLESTDGRELKAAGPSVPAAVAGWKGLPEPGRQFKAVASEKVAKTEAQAEARLARPQNLAKSIGAAPLEAAIAAAKVKQLPLVIKADVQGSLDTVIKSLATVGNQEAEIKVTGHGVGPISERDVHQAESGGAIIVGFNVNLPTQIKQQAARAKVPVRIYRVIYELIDELKKELESRLEPETIETSVGTLEVKGVFRITRQLLICGGLVKAGKISKDLVVKWNTDKGSREIGVVTNVQKGQADAKEVVEGEMCGLSITTKDKANVKVGDELELISRTTKAKKL